ncbi:Odorant receptor 43, partial [Halyomorpha halys]
MTYQDVIEDSDIIDGLSVRYLKLFGLWKVINDYRTTGKRNKIIKITVLVSFILIVPYITFQCISYFKIKVDIQKATFLNLNSMFALQLCCRLLVFWYRMGSQCRLVNLLKKDFLNIPTQNRKAVDEMYKKISKTSNMCCTTYMISNIIIVVLLIAKPDTSVDYILYHTGNMDAITTGRKKILGGWYPFPMNESPYYELIFIYESICSIWTGLLLVVYFCLFFQVLFSLYAQFMVLGLHIGTLKIEDQDQVHKNDIKMYETFQRVLKDHQNLLRYSEELISVYNPLVTMTLGMGVLVLIIGALQFLLEKASPTFIIKILQVLMFQGIEVCLFCFGSSFIETASSDLQFATYSSEWYEASKRLKTSVQMMMIAAVRGVRLTAIRMYPVNRETLMA